ncbi:MAG: hypothetical protein Q8867_10255 [Bacteroidota bacterium]|nr:hypothetical protein [Bacteroidota bacterium]
MAYLIDVKICWSRLSVFGLFLLLPFFNQGQDTVLLSRSVQNYSVRYSGDDSSWFHNGNEILKIISEDVVKNLRSTRIRVKFTVAGYRVESHGNFRILSVFSDPEVEGDIHYRGFCLSDVLVPDQIRIVYKAYLKNNPPASSEFIAENVSFPGTAGSQNDTSRFDSLAVSNLVLFYSEDAFDAFSRKISLINDYYASSAILDSISSDLSAIDRSNSAHFPELFIKLEELNKILTLIGSRDMVDNLNLSRNDPEDLVKKFKDLKKRSLSYNMTLREGLSDPRLVIDRKNISHITDEFTGMMLRYVRWSHYVNARNSVIYREFLQEFYNQQAFGDDIHWLSLLLAGMYPDQPKDTLIRHFWDALDDSYCRRAGFLMDQGRYSDAGDLMNSDLCLHSTISGSSVKVQEYRERAIAGIFRSFLSVAENSIRSGRLKMAESYLDKAKEVAPERINTDTLYRKIFNFLLSEKLSACDTLYAHRQYEDALNCYRAIELSFDSASLFLVHEALKSRIALSRFELNYTNGLQMLEKRDYNSAGQYFQNARRQCLDAGKYLDQNLDSLCTLTYPFYLVHRLEVASSLIWNDRLSEAKGFADSIGQITRTRGLEKDSVLCSALNSYRNKIRERECGNQQVRIDILMVRAERQKEMGNFDRACEFMDSIRIVVNYTHSCRLILPSIKDSLEKYSYAGNFQKGLKEISPMLSSAKYQDALEKYLQLLEDYERFDLKRFGLTIQPLADYVRQMENPQFTQAVLNYYALKNDTRSQSEYQKILQEQAPEKKRKNKILYIFDNFRTSAGRFVKRTLTRYIPG